MMTYAPITAAQQKRLQTLYSQVARHTQEGASREARLAWASEAIGRNIGSFNDLNSAEAKQLIDSAQAQLGVKAPAKRDGFRGRMGREAAQQAGTEGRKDGNPDTHTMASATDVDRIHAVMDVLGWNQAMLTSWMQSPRGPLARRTEIRTVGDANRVYWGLKRIAKAKGLWRDRRSA